MRAETDTWPTSIAIQTEAKILLNPDYQRGAVWSVEKNQLLIDSILRGYDIPKFYLRVVDADPYEYEVVDGQQRLRAIWDFVHGKYLVGDISLDILPSFVGKTYEELPSKIQRKFGSFKLTITELSDSDEREIRDLFLRLQEGSTLTPPEKRNAMMGGMRDFVVSTAKHPFLSKTMVKNDRFQHDDLVAHMTAIELSSGPTDVKAADLKKLYSKNEDFKPTSTKAKKIGKVLNVLNKSFKGTCPELQLKWGVVDIYALTSYLIDRYDMSGKEDLISEFYLYFEDRRRKSTDKEALLKSKDPADADLFKYLEAFERDGAKQKNIKTRLGVYQRGFLARYPSLVAKDTKRNFSNVERVVIWRAAKERCQQVGCGKKISFLEMHADHIIPHAKGGVTSLENAQCLCRDCNLKKGSKP